MLPTARLSDKWVGTCFAHTTPIPVSGTIIQGSGTVMDNGLPNARLGDRVVASCGHTGCIITGSVVNIDEGKPMARIGDKVAGPFVGTIISGSQNVIIG